MKLLLTVVLALVFSINSVSQSLTVSFTSAHQSNQSSEFPLKDGVLTATQSSYAFGEDGSRVDIQTPIAFSMSKERARIGVVHFTSSLTSSVYDYRGNLVAEAEPEFFDATDETIGITVLDSGEFILRDNVANFTFFDAAGNRGYSVSNATQATGGERPSGVSYSSEGETVVFYNPVVRYSDTEEGSRVSVAAGEEDEESTSVYSSRTRTIDRLDVSSNGSFITFSTSAGDQNSRVLIFDRFGNQLQEIDFEMTLSGFDLTENGRYLTVYSDNRVQVYRTSDLERLGSSTSRSRIIHAAYQPEMSTILTLEGQIRNGSVSDPQISAIDLERRDLNREQLSGSISFLDRKDIRISRTSEGAYQISGINRPIEVSISR